jgi:hypothetical protein
VTNDAIKNHSKDQSAAARLAQTNIQVYFLHSIELSIRKVLDNRRRHLEFNIHIGPNSQAVPLVIDG